MTAAFLLYDLRRAVTVLILVLAIATGCALFLPGPLQGGVPNVFQLVGLFTGALLSGRLLSDTGGTQAYVYSRGLTRRRVVLLRVVLGLTLILVMGLWLWLVISLGLRERWHILWRSPDSIFYPMSTQFETSIIRPFLGCSVISFGLMSFYMTWRGLCQASWNGTSTGIYRLIVVEAPVGVVMLWMLVFSGGVLVMPGDIDDYGDFVSALSWMPLGLSAVAVVMAWIAARNLEAV